jgi:Trk K+ transport system NAD-binding subunit
MSIPFAAAASAAAAGVELTAAHDPRHPVFDDGAAIQDTRDGTHDAGDLERHIIVCGLDGVGMRVVEQLQQSGQTVVALGEFVEPARRPALLARGVRLVGSAGDVASTLEAAGVRKAQAVVCVTGSELTNLEIALTVRQFGPDIRVVTQLANRAIGDAVRADGGPGAVLDVATLAAPSIVEACLLRRVHDIPVPGVPFRVVTLDVEHAGTLRAAYGDLAPVAVVHDPHGPVPEVVPCPGRDLPVQPGDLAALLGTDEDFAAAGVLIPEPPPGERISRSRRMWAMVAGVAHDLDRGFYRAAGLLFSLVLISTLLLWRTYKLPGMSLLDALYFSTETVATVGYGDFNFVSQPPLLRLWAIFLMFAGITCTAVLMAYLADMLISRRLGAIRGRHRARVFSGHVVLAGLGAFGIRVAAELLDAGKTVVAIERDPSGRFLPEAQRLGVPVVIGDAADANVLAQAGLSRASAVAILTSNDTANIESALAVREVLRPRWESGAEVPMVIRVFDRTLGRTIAERFHFRNVASTEESTAPWFVGAALGLDVLGAFPVGRAPFVVARLRVNAGSRLDGAAMQSLSQHTRVVALHRSGADAPEHPPRRGTRFAGGDLAYLVGPWEELLDVLRHANDPLVERVAGQG